MRWIESQSTPVIALMVFGFCYVLTIAILCLAAMLSRRAVAQDLKAVVPMTLTTPLGVILGLLIAFLASRVWTNVDRASEYVGQEAGAIRATVLLVDSLPSDIRAGVRQDVQKHIYFIESEEWPAMASGRATLQSIAVDLAEAMTRLVYDDAYMRDVLKRVQTIAAVGISANDMRPSYFAMLYLQQKGYRMIPVNPRYAGQQILGETVVASLDDLPVPPDMVQVFRKADEAPGVVDEAIKAGAKVVWMQLGIRSDEAAAKALAAGLDVVMDRCPKIEYGRLFGEIGWAGVNRRVISAKKGQAMQLSHKKGGLALQPVRGR